MKRDQVKKKLEVKQVQRGDSDPRQVCGTKLKLNFVKTEVAVTKTKFPYLSPGSPKRLQKRSGFKILPECPQGPAKSQPHSYNQVKHAVVIKTM